MLAVVDLVRNLLGEAELINDVEAELEINDVEAARAERLFSPGYETARKLPTRSVSCAGESAAFKRAANEISDRFHKLNAPNLRQLKKELAGEDLFYDVCELEVPINYLDSELRKDRALHIRGFRHCDYFENSGCRETVEAHWWDESTKSSKNLNGASDEITTKATLGLLCIEDAAKVGYEGIIRPLLMHGAPTDFFESDAVKTVVHFKWCKHWKKRFFWNFVYYAIFTAGFTAYMCFLSFYTNEVEFQFITSTLLVGLAAYGVQMCREEFTQIRTYVKDAKADSTLNKGGLRHYFSSVWNWIDLVVIVLLCAIIVLHIGSLIDSAFFKMPLVTAAVMECVLVYVKAFYYAQQYRFIAAFLISVQAVFLDICVVLALSVVFMCFTAYAMYQLVDHFYEEGDDIMNDFGTYGDSIRTLLDSLSLGLDLSAFSDDGLYCYLLIALLLCFVILEYGLFFNVILSFVSSTLEGTKNPNIGRLVRAQARFIDASEAALKEEEQEKLNERSGRYLIAVMKPSDDNDAKQLATIKETMGTMLKDTERRVEQSVTNLSATVANLSAKVDRLMKHLERSASGATCDFGSPSSAL